MSVGEPIAAREVEYLWLTAQLVDSKLDRQQQNEQLVLMYYKSDVN